MIDKITLTKTGLSQPEIKRIVEYNKLQTNTKAGILYYDNMITKNLEQDKGVYIRIEPGGRLKIECSLHKYYNETINKLGRVNYNAFSMLQARETLIKLLNDKQIVIIETNVYYYEIGLNLPLSNDCRTYMDKMKSIGMQGNNREFIPHQRYKDKREKTTLFHKDIRKYYKVYDKVFEMIDRKKEIPRDNDNILRIETVNRRISNQTAEKFFEQNNLNKLKAQFIKDWQTLKFDKILIVPKGTNERKRELCKRILEKGTETVLNNAREQSKTGVISQKTFRGIREFIQNDWDKIKTELRLESTQEEKEFKTVFIWLCK